MKRNRLAICDPEQAYAYRLTDALSRKEDFPFEILTFTNADRLQEGLARMPVQLLVIAQNAFRAEMKGWPVSGILLLRESEPSPDPALPQISKYTAVSGIARRILEEAAGIGCIPFLPAAATGAACRFLGLYTPVGRCLQTTFAFTIGQLLAKSCRVLYLNFESHSGLPALLGRTFGPDFSGLLYHLDEPREALLERLYRMTESVNGMDLIPPAFSGSDIYRTGPEEWMKLLDALQHSRYDRVILDLSDGVQGLFEILRLCRTVYTIVKDDSFAQAKLHQYQTLLAEADCPEVLEKTRQLLLPVFRQLPGDLNHMTNGELALLAERILEEDEPQRI